MMTRIETIGKDRIPVFDALKGAAILLMIINHVRLDGAWIGRFVDVFHMPLFFLISGYLFKPRSVKETAIKNLSKILVPYLLTCMVIWILMCVVKGDYQWGLSILWGNSRPFAEHYSVGPLWFLTAFFCAMIYANLLLKIEKKSIRWAVILSVFAASALLVRLKGVMLPFGLTTGGGG